METNNSELNGFEEYIKKTPYILDCNLSPIGDNKDNVLISYGKRRTISLSDNQTLTIKPIDILVTQVKASQFVIGFFADYIDSKYRRVKNIKNISCFLEPFAKHYREILGEDWDNKKTTNRFYEIVCGRFSHEDRVDRNIAFSAALDKQLSFAPTYELEHNYTLSDLGNRYLVMAFGELDTIEPDGSHKIEEIPLGFFGCTSTVRPIGKYGECIQAEELFVRPEFRGYHIGLDLVAAMLINARLNEINYLEGLSYADQNSQPMKWWQKIGACDEQTIPNKDGLIIISGEIDTLLNNIFNIQHEKKQPTP